jgi:hypothetical protein
MAAMRNGRQNRHSVYNCVNSKMSIRQVGFEVLRAVNMKSNILCDVTPCSPVEVRRRIEQTYCLHFQVREVSQRRNRQQAELFDPNNGSSIFLRNVLGLPSDCTALHPRRQWVFNNKATTQNMVILKNGANSSTVFKVKSKVIRQHCKSNYLMTIMMINPFVKCTPKKLFKRSLLPACQRVIKPVTK